MLLFKKTTQTAQDVIDDLGVLLKDATSDIWTVPEKLGALRQAIRKLYPDVFIPKTDASLVTEANKFKYIIPIAFDLVMGVDIKSQDASAQWQGVPFTTEWDGTNNNIVFQSDFTPGLSIQIRGGSRLIIPTTVADELDVSVDSEDLMITGAKIELMEVILLDKGKMNQFAAREVGVTEMDVINMLAGLKRDYAKRKGEIATLLIAQITRI